MGRAQRYIIELVQIDVKNLLTVTNEDDSGVVKDFDMFLRNYVSENRKSIYFSKLTVFEKIIVSMCFMQQYIYNIIIFSIKNIGTTEVSQQV